MPGPHDLQMSVQGLFHPDWNEGFFRTALDHADMAVLVINPEYEIVYGNHCIGRLIGLPQEALIGMELPRHKTVPDEDLQRVIDHMVRVLEQGVAERIENWALRPDGSKFLMLWSSTPLCRSDGAIQYLLSVGMDVTEQHVTKNRLESLANRDALTGLHNRMFFDLRLAEDLQKVLAEEGGGLALLFIDLDGFKAVNDDLGHDVGDAVLCEVAGRLRAKVRKSDVVCRLGGDEFVVILPNPPSRAVVEELASGLIEALAKPYDALGGQPKALSASIGIALAPQDGTDPQALVHAADAAMYLAKRAGKNGFSFTRG